MKERKERIYKIIMIIVLTAFVTFMLTSFGVYSYLEGKPTDILAIENDSDNIKDLIGGSNNLDLEKYLKKIRETIDKYYLWNEDISDAELKKAAIEGYVAGLGDEYTEYIPADEMNEFREEINRKFCWNRYIYAFG